MDCHISKSRGRATIHSEIRRHEFYLVLIKVRCKCASVSCAPARAVPPRLSSSVAIAPFPLVLLKIAILKKITIPKKELSRRRKQGQQVSLAKANLPNAPRALEQVFEEFLAPVRSLTS